MTGRRTSSASSGGLPLLVLALSLSPVELRAAPPVDEGDTTSSKKKTRAKRRDRKQKEPPPVGELSSGGTDRGGLEIGLGVVTLGVAASLAAVGSFAIVTGLNRQHQCRTEYTTDCDLVTPRTDFAAAGLSFGMMIPLTTAGALLLRKASRIRRDYDVFHAQASAFALGGSPRAIHLSWTLRF